jgi:hypothetical protein
MRSKIDVAVLVDRPQRAVVEVERAVGRATSDR